MSETLISVILPAYNAEATLPLCLTALLRQTRPPDEIIVIDNRSTDATVAIAQEFQRRSRLIHVCREDRQGDGPACNRGVAESTGEILAFTDADCVPDTDWLEHLISPFHADPSLEATAGVLAGHEPETFVQRCLSVTAFPMLDAQTVKGLPFPPTFPFYTANFAIRRDVMGAIGGFDEGLWIGKDVDLCCSVLGRNGRIQYVPNARVGHIHRDTVRKMMRRLFQYGIGIPPIFRKHFPSKACLTLPGGWILPLPRWLRPCWINLGAPDRILLLLGLCAIWQPWAGVLAGLYTIRVGCRLRQQARVRGARIAPWEWPLLTALHIGGFSAYTAGCALGALRSRVLCVV